MELKLCNQSSAFYSDFKYLEVKSTIKYLLFFWYRYRLTDVIFAGSPLGYFRPIMRHYARPKTESYWTDTAKRFA